MNCQDCDKFQYHCSILDKLRNEPCKDFEYLKTVKTKGEYESSELKGDRNGK